MTQISDQNFDICYFCYKKTHWFWLIIDFTNKLPASMEKFLSILDSNNNKIIPTRKKQDTLTQKF